MSRGRKRTETVTTPTSAVVQPSIPKPEITAKGGKAMLAKLFNISADDVDRLAKAKEEIGVFAATAQAQEYAQRMQSEAENRHIREWASRSCLDRTQEVVDHNWGADTKLTRYQVQLVRNPDVRGTPESFPLVIPANSPEEAQGRYMSVCGIRSTDHYIQASPVDAKIAAKAAPADEDYVPEERIPEGAFVEAD